MADTIERVSYVGVVDGGVIIDIGTDLILLPPKEGDRMNILVESALNQGGAPNKSEARRAALGAILGRPSGLSRFRDTTDEED